MKRTAPTCILLACVVLVVVGCHGSSSLEPPLATATASLAVVVLTADRPTARIAQPRLPLATAIRLDVQAVTNPGGQGLMIGLAVADATTTARRLDVGTVSLYPSDQPGIFTLVLPGPAADLVHQAATVIIVTVSVILSGAGLQPSVRLTLTAELTRR